MRFKVSQSKRATLQNVLYVPKLSCNLFSVRAAASKSNTVKFGRTRCWIRSNAGELLGMGSLADKLYQLDCEPATLEHASVVHQQASDVDLWHQRLGHLSGQRLSDMSRKKSVVGLNLSTTTKPSFCEGCVEGKMHRAPFKSVGGIRSTRKLQLVHSDVCGPMRTESIGGHKYFVTFYSRCCAVYFLKQKSEVFEKFREFEASATNECGRKIGALRTDNGGEYVSNEFEAYLKSKGIRHELTIAHTPEQNGVTERTNRTLMESARAMLCHAGMPNHYWAEAVKTAAYLKNRVVTSAIKECRTPFEKWYERKPDVSHLRVFGCVAYAHVPDCSRHKLDKKADKLRFIGYCTNSKGYRLFDEKTRKLIKSRDVTFKETDFDLRKSEADVEQHTEVVDTDTESGTPEEEAVNEPQEVREVRRSERDRRPRSRYINEYADTAKVDHVAYKACEIIEPKSIEEAPASGHAKEWKIAACSMDSPRRRSRSCSPPRKRTRRSRSHSRSRDRTHRRRSRSRSRDHQSRSRGRDRKSRSSSRDRRSSSRGRDSRSRSRSENSHRESKRNRRSRTRSRIRERYRNKGREHRSRSRDRYRRCRNKDRNRSRSKEQRAAEALRKGQFEKLRYAMGIQEF